MASPNISAICNDDENYILHKHNEQALHQCLFQINRIQGDILVG